jgi:hypothetical protein
VDHLDRTRAKHNPFSRQVRRAFQYGPRGELLATKQDLGVITEANIRQLPAGRAMKHGYSQTPPWDRPPYDAISFEHLFQFVPFLPAGANVTTIWTLDVPEKYAAHVYGYVLTIPPAAVDLAVNAQIEADIYDRNGAMPYTLPIRLDRWFQAWGASGLVAAASQHYGHRYAPYGRNFMPRSQVRLVLITGPAFPGTDNEIGALVLGWLWPIQAGMDPDY